MGHVVEQWIERAEYDLETAISLLKGKRYLYVAFMCQQSIEKMLKAYIASLGKNPPLVHNLLRLSEEAKKIAAVTKEFVKWLRPKIK